MRAAYRLARDALPAYSSEFSRHGFTLPQLFACLVVKESLRRSYREAEALLADCGGWRRDVGLDRAPDHDTLWRAAHFLPAAGPTTRTSSRSCSAPGGGCRTARSRSWPTRGTTRSPTTSWPGGTWAYGR
jgi:hypothetical protein